MAEGIYDFSHSWSALYPAFLAIHLNLQSALIYELD